MLTMQFLVNGAIEFDEPGLMISFEESPGALKANFPITGPSTAKALQSGVQFLDGRHQEDAVEAGAFDLGGLVAIASSIVKRHRVKRITVDGIDVLFASSRDDANRRREITRLLNWLADSSISSVLTMKGADGKSTGPPYADLAEYAADGVLHLKTEMLGQLARRTLTVIKMRGTAFLEGAHPYIIGRDGIRVLHSITETDEIVQALDLRISTGIERLDHMLRGGHRVGTTTLITGLPGTSKTTMGAAFLQAGIARGERCLFVGFDEPVRQVLVDAGSVGIDLNQGMQSGLLQARSFAPGGSIADAHFLAIEALIDSHKPARVVIDPITALEKAGGLSIAEATMERLVLLLKTHGITAVFTAIAESPLGEQESTSMRVSTIADTWIHLSFTNRGGERNRTLTIVKSRGTAHSNQMREMLLTQGGITLADVYTSAGEVLLGTARAQKERQDLAEREAESDAVAVALERVDRSSGDLREALLAAQRGLDQLAADRAELLRHAETSGAKRTRASDYIHELRRGDVAGV
jgi:circadian clock protein KaiC